MKTISRKVTHTLLNVTTIWLKVTAFIFRSHWSFSLPKRNPIVIFENSGVDFLGKLVNLQETTTLCLRGEKWYLPLVIRSRFTASGFRGRFIEAYLLSFLDYVKPVLVITNVDESPLFHSISKHRPKIATAFIQNGRRFSLGDFFENPVPDSNSKARVDLMFVFSEPIGQAYEEYLEGRYLAIGSLKNNAYPLKRLHKEKIVVFPSGYESLPKRNKPLRKSQFFGDVSHETYFSLDAEILNTALAWCASEGVELVIARRTSQEKGEEFDFYKKIFSDKQGWRFLPKTSEFSSYELMERSLLVIHADSTMGYEALARGLKVAFISGRSNYVQDSSFHFGWPGKFQPKGPFWTDSADKSEIERILDFLVSISVDEWDAITKPMLPKLMCWDPGNQQAILALKQLFEKANSGIIE